MSIKRKIIAGALLVANMLPSVGAINSDNEQKKDVPISDRTQVQTATNVSAVQNNSNTAQSERREAVPANPPSVPVSDGTQVQTVQSTSCQTKKRSRVTKKSKSQAGKSSKSAPTKKRSKTNLTTPKPPLSGAVQMVPQGTIQMVPQGTVPMFPQGTIQMVPQGSVQMMPQGTIQIVPQGAVQMMPQGTIPIFPQGTVPMVPQGTIQMVPQGAVQMMPQGTIQMVPQGAVQMMPQRTIQMVPQKATPISQQKLQVGVSSFAPDCYLPKVNNFKHVPFQHVPNAPSDDEDEDSEEARNFMRVPLPCKFVDPYLINAVYRAYSCKGLKESLKSSASNLAFPQSALLYLFNIMDKAEPFDDKKYTESIRCLSNFIGNNKQLNSFQYFMKNILGPENSWIDTLCINLSGYEVDISKEVKEGSISKDTVILDIAPLTSRFSSSGRLYKLSKMWQLRPQKDVVYDLVCFSHLDMIEKSSCTIIKHEDGEWYKYSNHSVENISEQEAVAFAEGAFSLIYQRR